MYILETAEKGLQASEYCPPGHYSLVNIVPPDITH